ncbi:hypothetical protein FB451DRAFT_308206 [Mycena latifolia]|nr:hypothetical protein FB451DRAFT_308206 [Mycena latifolia]
MAYPVLTLPFDIISQIFVYCLPQEDDALPWRTEAPLLLAGICREWRDIALCTHELWNTMHLNLRPHTVLKVAPLLSFWIPRAGSFPISMSLLYKFKGDNSITVMDALVALVRQYAPHWTTIELHIPLSALLPLNFQTKNFASLKKLVLHCGSDFYSRKQRVVRAFSESNAPKLRELQIISGTVTPAAIALPWQQLVTLRLDNSTAVACLQALADAPNVVNVTCILWSLGGHPPARLLHLPRLESLKLLLSHARGPALLRRLQAPALQHLELDLPESHHIEEMTDFIVRSTCFIRRLSVMFGPPWTANDFLRLFGAMDSLEELEIRKGGQSIDAAFHLLKAQPSLLPNLRLLHVNRTILGTEDAELLADLLETRWNIPVDVSFPVRLESFRLISPLTTAPEIDSIAVLRLARLLVSGMKIQIISSRSWLHFGL